MTATSPAPAAVRAARPAGMPVQLGALWSAGEVAYGLWTTLADPVTLTLGARAGFEYVCLDLQHGMCTFADLPTALRYLQGSSAAALVRVPANDEAAINRALDLGAAGVVVPMVNTAADAAAAVAACRYPALPASGRGPGTGARSWGPIFADLDGPVSTDDANDAVVCVVQIETQEAIDNLDHIAAVDGLDGLYVGPNDLALSCGYGQATYRDEPQIEAMISRVLTVCAGRGLVAGVHCSDVGMVAHWRERGARMLTTGIDTTIVKDALQARYRAAAT